MNTTTISKNIGTATDGIETTGIGGTDGVNGTIAITDGGDLGGIGIASRRLFWIAREVAYD